MILIPLKIKVVRLNTVYILLLLSVCKDLANCQIYLRKSMNSVEEQKENADQCEIDDAKGIKVSVKPSVEVITHPSCEGSTNPSNCDEVIESDKNSNCCQESKEDCETNNCDVIVAGLSELKGEDKNGDVEMLEDNEVDCNDIDNTASGESDKTREASETHPHLLDQNSLTGEEKRENLDETTVQSSIDNQDSHADENNSSLGNIVSDSESSLNDFSQTSLPASQHSRQSEENADDFEMLDDDDDDSNDNTVDEKDAVEKPGSGNSNSPTRAEAEDSDESETPHLNSQVSEEISPSQNSPATLATDSSQEGISVIVSDTGKKGSASKKSKKRKSAKNAKTFSHYGDRDTENYRRGYPDLKDDKKLNKNVLFYKGEIKSEPDGDFIDTIHAEWRNNFSLLEFHHGYIQWLFPIRESGMNWQAQPLQLHEAKAIVADKVAHARVLESYKMMLGFYGMRLEDEVTGTIRRSKHYEKCFDNLSKSRHNYLRITRILKSLGELGYEHLKKPFLQFLLHEALVEGTLSNTLDSCKNYWIGTIKDDAVRKVLYGRIEEQSQQKSTTKSNYKRW